MYKVDPPSLPQQWPLHIRMTREHPRPAIYLGPVWLRDVDDLTRARWQCDAANRALRLDYQRACRIEAGEYTLSVCNRWTRRTMAALNRARRME